MLQKFRSVAGLDEMLLATGNRIIALMDSNDRIWGTGLDPGHADASRPERWRGTNLLGWALIEARATIRADRDASMSELPARGKPAAGVSAGGSHFMSIL